MPHLPVSTQAGSVGLIIDVDPTMLPAEGWSAGRNVRTRDGRLIKSKGPQTLYGACPIVPYSVFPVQIPGQILWVAMGAAAAYVNDGTGWTKITRYLASFSWVANQAVVVGYKIKDANGNCQQVTTAGTTGATVPTFSSTLNATTNDGTAVWTCKGSATVDNPYTGAVTNRWNGDFFNGVLVLNNSVDQPQAWLGFNTGTRLSDLQNWPTGDTCAVMRAFKNFLIALGGNIGGVAAGYTVRWSAPADPGNPPSSWNYADPTSQAGTFPIAQTGGGFIDGATMGDNFIIYKSDSVYTLQFVGGVLVFGEKPIFTDIGLLAQNCVVEFNKKHFVVTPNDVVVHDGYQWNSVIDGKMRKWLFGQIDHTQVKNTFVVRNQRDSEIWICFAQVGSAYPNTALIWSYKDNSWTVIDLPLLSDAKEFVVEPAVVVDTFTGGSSGPFTTDYQSFFVDYTDTTNKWVVGVSPSTSQLYQMDQLETNNGTPFLAFMERTGLDFGHPEMTKRISPYYENLQPQKPGIVLVTDVYPKIRSTGPVQIQVGTQARDLTDPTAWTAPFTFDPTKQSRISTLISGRLVGFRISSQADVHWELDGYGITFENIGDF